MNESRDSDWPQPSAPLRPRRPFFLVLAVGLVWLVGLIGATDGCRTIDVLRHGDDLRTALDRVADVQFAERGQALIGAILRYQRVAAPLAAAELVLGALLTFAASTMLFGRRHAHSLLRQAAIAYALFLPVDYVLRRPIRRVLIDSIVSDPSLAKLGVGSVSPADIEKTLREAMWWFSRGILGVQLLVLIVAIVMFTRPSVRAWFTDRVRSEPPPGQ